MKRIIVTLCLISSIMAWCSFAFAGFSMKCRNVKTKQWESVLLMKPFSASYVKKTATDASRKARWDKCKVKIHLLNKKTGKSVTYDYGIATNGKWKKSEWLTKDLRNKPSDRSLGRS